MALHAFKTFSRVNLQECVMVGYGRQLCKQFSVSLEQHPSGQFLNYPRSDTVSCHLMASKVLFGRKIQNPAWHQICSYAKGMNKGRDKNKKGKKEAKIKVGDISEEFLDNDQMQQEFQAALEGMKEEYAKALSLRASLKSFETLTIKTDDGEYPLNVLGHVIQKSPQMIQIDMTSSPQYVHHVANALNTSGMNLNVQQEGLTIFVPVPKVTREHREKLAKSAKDIFNNYKKALGNIYSHHTMNAKDRSRGHPDEFERIEKFISQELHSYQGKAEELMKTKQKELLNG